MAIDLPPYSDELRVDVVTARAEVIVAPSGEIDLHTVPRVEEAVRELRAAGFDRVVVDLTRITFIDSSGLGMLLSLRNAARRTEQALEIVPGPPTVQRVFDLTATNHLFDWRTPAGRA